LDRGEGRRGDGDLARAREPVQGGADGTRPCGERGHHAALPTPTRAAARSRDLGDGRVGRNPSGLRGHVLGRRIAVDRCRGELLSRVDRERGVDRRDLDRAHGRAGDGQRGRTGHALICRRNRGGAHAHAGSEGAARAHADAAAIRNRRDRRVRAAPGNTLIQRCLRIVRIDRGGRVTHRAADPHAASDRREHDLLQRRRGHGDGRGARDTAQCGADRRAAACNGADLALTAARVAHAGHSARARAPDRAGGHVNRRLIAVARCRGQGLVGTGGQIRVRRRDGDRSQLRGCHRYVRRRGHRAECRAHRARAERQSRNRACAARCIADARHGRRIARPSHLAGEVYGRTVRVRTRRRQRLGQPAWKRWIFR